MYSILIVDDEELVRRAVISKLDWMNMGFDMVLEAEDGEQALELALTHKPNVVLTDIRMPFMDGLELSEKLSQQLPASKIIILSGHDEFEYAQEAIKIGVMDYILKPIHAARLSELIRNVKDILDSERNEKEKLQKLKSQLHQSLPLLKERFFNSLMHGSIHAGEIQKTLDFLEIRLPGSQFTVCVSEIDNLSVLSEHESAEGIALLGFSVLNIISELVGGLDGIAFDDPYGRQVMLFCHSDQAPGDTYDRVYPVLEQIRESIHKYLHITVTLAIGSCVKQLRDLSKSYRDALHALDYKIATGKNRVLDIRDFIDTQTDFYYPMDKVSNLLAVVKLENPETVSAQVDRFFDELMARKGMTPENVKLILSELFNGIQRILLELRNENSEQLSLDFGFYEKISKYETLEEIKNGTRDYIREVCLKIRLVRNSRNLQIIDKARQYIHEQYTVEDLSLNQAASAVAVSPGYLSVLFRKETGETFIEYLTKIRMEKAKELLKTSSLKAYEVAYKVGYSDPHYFSMCFKKYTGQTPSDYKAG